VSPHVIQTTENTTLLQYCKEVCNDSG